jgi:hypothetical protein
MKKMRIAIIQSNYIPWIGYFELIRNVDKFILYEDVQYTKNDWRNRNYLRENKKINWLSIPVKHQSLKQKFNEVLVSDNIWTKKHFNTIHHTFSKEKNFRKYDEELLSLYKQSASEIYLYKINRIFLNWVLFKLNITTEIQYIEKLENNYGPNEKLINILNEYHNPTYVSGPAAKSYIDEEIFHKNNIAIEYIDYNKLLSKYLGESDVSSLNFSVIQFLFQKGLT